MMVVAISGLQPGQSDIQVAVITGAFALVGIVAAGILARISTHPRTPRIDPDARAMNEASPLATYSGEQNDFMHLVIQDSKMVHERLNNFESIVQEMKKERTQLIGAFSRYIAKLVGSWGTGSKIPYPDEDDFKILEETLPADWRRRIK